MPQWGSGLTGVVEACGKVGDSGAVVAFACIAATVALSGVGGMCENRPQIHGPGCA